MNKPPLMPRGARPQAASVSPYRPSPTRFARFGEQRPTGSRAAGASQQAIQLFFFPKRREGQEDQSRRQAVACLLVSLCPHQMEKPPEVLQNTAKSRTSCRKEYGASGPESGTKRCINNSSSRFANAIAFSLAMT
jgi:hypothetical protein